ncbi:MAG: sodium:proton antiporter NhaD, partial [Chitinophagales bacterium]|nr:sodium:proton antiporter NhaD [Chitinophagales bacterium]
LSAILDNLTTAIVMVTLVQKILHHRNDRLLFSSMIVIAANAGGAWSPIGDVTTTMLWIGNQISTLNIIKELFLPSLLCLIVPLLYQSRLISGTFERANQDKSETLEAGGQLILILGVLGLLFVPIFKTITHLPPYMGMLGSVGVLWTVTELMHHGKEDRTHLRIYHALTRIDVPSTLFFLGILLAVSCLESIGQLNALATWLDTTIGNKEIIVTLLGALSAVVDNVPLTAAVQGMYSLDMYPTDHKIWEMLAYAVGTGGSMLIIGSAAGVVVMGMENISFGWYMRKIAFTAMLGYLAGIATYLAIFALLGH